jgi:hypothetical protein
MVIAIGGDDLRDEQERVYRDVVRHRFRAALLDLSVVELFPE